MKRTFTHVPPFQGLGSFSRYTRMIAGTALFPMYWMGAQAHALPGLRFACDSARLGLRALRSKEDALSYSEIYRMFFAPIESTRYMEFGLAWDFISDLSIDHYLDVSSPRLFPLAVTMNRKGIVAQLINPNREDLQVTAGLVQASGLAQRCTLWDCLIENAPLQPHTFDVITSLSVVEHISADTNAVLRMWDLLKPGGKLILSVPCAATAEEQFIDVDHYGLQSPDEKGFYFLQYVYDASLLQERFYAVLGPPARYGIYGEKVPGSLRRGLVQKWIGEKYPRWKEPYIMARSFQRYETVDNLPGEGVIVLEFSKK
ncbi:MAG TPA: methyltransferase domain-containing protein [Candidatus Sulfotelmatobacter sp.]|nr:methyltransferase domain-containing protein [Candidatus Sulfotelmatobacter sp.]